ncbi:MAG: acyl carrier protein [Clostridia bacterium]|nr:acyl carrier protein [Clostridia bacterium]
MEKILEILEGCCPGVDFETETALIDNGILESLDIVMIVGELSDEFGIEITVDDLTAENFNSAEAIFNLVNKLKEEE